MFLLDPRNQAFAEGTSPKPAQQKGFSLLIVFPLIMCLMALPFPLYLGKKVGEWYLFSHQSTKIPGVVLRLDTGSDSDGDPVFEVTYQFQAINNGQVAPVQTNSEQVTRAFYETLRPKNIVQVKYIPLDPSLSRLTNNPAADDNSLLPLAGFIFVWYGIILIPVYLGIKNRAQEQKFQQQAQPLTGVILSCTSSLDSDNDLILNIRYQFTTPAGQTITNDISKLANQLRNKPLPQAGSAVAIAYCDEKNYRLL